mmetsp:Transcript_34876/g.73561  ORF Transcript_34876/g.73561 Transcript_34876/m.73561 type:complete len:235 (-) Transcript_34876:66-770(-)
MHYFIPNHPRMPNPPRSVMVVRNHLRQARRLRRWLGRTNHFQNRPSLANPSSRTLANTHRRLLPLLPTMQQTRQSLRTIRTICFLNLTRKCPVPNMVVLVMVVVVSQRLPNCSRRQRNPKLSRQRKAKHTMPRLLPSKPSRQNLPPRATARTMEHNHNNHNISNNNYTDQKCTYSTNPSTMEHSNNNTSNNNYHNKSKHTRHRRHVGSNKSDLQEWNSSIPPLFDLHRRSPRLE